MAESLGISIGTANLVATSSSGSPTVRRSVLTVFGHRRPEVGTPAENPQLNERGLVLTGFVERVGDPVPLVAADGSSFRGEQLMADALEALSRAANSGGRSDFLSATVPAHWRPNVVESLRAALRDRRGLTCNGEPLPLVSEVVAALTALQSRSGLPARGIIALCDFGAAGTSITLADAADGYRSVGPTVRYEDFSGDLIDQAILRQVLTDLEVDPSSTSAVVALGQVRDQCRRAKERLSHETATGLTGPLPGAQSTVRLTRPELESLVREPLDGVIDVLHETLQRNNIDRNHLVAIATVGGGARIPIVTQRLSEALGIRVTTTPQAQVIAAVGAALIAGRGPEEETVTGVKRPAPAVFAAAVAAAAPATNTAQASAEVTPLAWSEDHSTEDVAPVGYSRHDGDDDDADPTDRARPKVSFGHGYASAEPARRIPSAAARPAVPAPGRSLRCRRVAGAGYGRRPDHDVAQQRCVDCARWYVERPPTVGRRHRAESTAATCGAGTGAVGCADADRQAAGAKPTAPTAGPRAGVRTAPGG